MAATTSPKTSRRLVAGGDQACAFVAGRDELEEQAGLGFEGDEAGLVDDE
jgi:hypothetical protein